MTKTFDSVFIFAYTETSYNVIAKRFRRARVTCIRKSIRCYQAIEHDLSTRQRVDESIFFEGGIDCADQTRVKQQHLHRYQPRWRFGVVDGPGIAFGKKRGQAVDMAKVEKTFFLKDQATMNKFTDLVIDVPLQEVDASERVINYAKIKLGKQLNENIYVNLTDHLHMAIKRFKEEGISLSNPLKWDIARFYPDEFAVGKKAVAVVKDAFDVDLGDDEAAFIAVHFINAEAGTDAEQNLAIGVTTIVKEVEDLVKAYFHTEFDEQSLNYYRFITHLKFFLPSAFY